MILTAHKNIKSPQIIEKQKMSFVSFFNFVYGVCASALLFYCLFFAGEKIGEFPVEYFLLFLNGAFSIYGMIASIRRNASIHFVSFLFCYLFMSLAPIVQAGAEIDPVFEMDFILLIVSSISLIFTLTGVLFLQRLPINQDVKKKENAIDFDNLNKNYNLLFWVTLFISLISIFLFKDGLFTSREGFGKVMAQIFTDQAIALVCLTLLKLTPFYGATIGLRAAWEEKNTRKIISFSFLFFLALIINNPISSPRYYLAGVAFFFIDYVTRGKKTHLLAMFLILGVIAAPLFHVFRRETPNPMAVKQEKTLMEKTLLSMDYDAVQTASYAVLTVRNDGIVWGENIAGSILFFVPRKLWPGKPTQTAFVVYDTMIKHRTVGTNNLSTPLVAEGYYAFSWFGVIAISLVYWLLVTKLTSLSAGAPRSLPFLLRAVYTGLVLIFLRGMLMVAMSAIVGFSVAAVIPWLLFTYGSDWKRKDMHEKTKNIFIKRV